MDSENILSIYCTIAEKTTLQVTPWKTVVFTKKQLFGQHPIYKCWTLFNRNMGPGPGLPYVPVSFRRLAMPICGVAMGIIQEKCPEEPETIAFQISGP